MPDTLPPEEREFVGRGPELALLTREHGDLPQVCVIEGMPGVGKTALAVRAARIAAAQHPDGTLYLNFHSHDASRAALDAGEALHRLLRMLSVPATQIPDPVGERAALWRAQLSRRRAVVILDDAARHDQIRPLLPVTGQCLILITARRRLPDIAGARLLVLDELPMDDAIALFSRITGPGMAPDPDEAATAVRMCGRLPLAIQLTAGRLGQRGSLTLADLIDELSRSPGRPASGGNAVVASPELRSAFDLSYRALDPEHQRLFRRMGVSPCAQFSLHGAAALAGGTLAEAEKAVTALLDHHLLARAGADQFRCHDLIREFAAARAAATDPPGEQRQAVSKLLDYYLCAADRADRLLHPFRRRRPVSPAGGPSPSPALRTRDDAAAWLESEWRNIAQAAQHAGRHEWQRQCADLAHALAGFIEIHGHWVEALTAHTLALRASRDLADPARIAQSCLELSRASQQTGRHEDTLALAQEAAATYQSLGDPPGLAEALDQIGLIHQRGARSREALAYFLEAGTLFEEAGDEHGVADTLSHSGIACWHLGRYPDAMTHLRHALSLYRGAGDRRGEAKTLHNLGKMELHSGRHRDALASFESALQVFTEIGGAQNQAILYHAIGNVHHYKGGHEQGIASYRQALALYRDLSDLPDQASVLADIGAIYKDADCYDEALIHYEQAKSIAEEIGSPAEQVVALRGIADVRRASGGCSEALDAYRAVLRLAREIGDLYGEAKALEGMAEAALSTHKSYEARILFRQALDIFERLGVPEAESARIRLEVTDPVLARRTS